MVLCVPVAQGRQGDDLGFCQRVKGSRELESRKICQGAYHDGPGLSWGRIALGEVGVGCRGDRTVGWRSH